jgi:serine/threonine protein kinase
MNPLEDPHVSREDESDREDPRLMQALREYQAALDAGRRPNRREFLSRYPEVAAELSECLAGLELLRSAAPHVQGPIHRAGPEPALPAEGAIGDFRLVRQIGRGGMGVVYEAVQLSLGRRVALKLLPPGSTLDARQLGRFENEARAAAQLHHSNIVPVFAVGSERGVPYYAMQFIDGRSLAEVIDALRQRPTPAAPAAETVAGAAALTEQSVASRSFFRTVATLGMQAAEALEHAHQMGVLHRDIKPANLLVDSRGNLWVTDFGLAYFQGSPSLTSPGDLVGTLRYMSPEQAAGRPVVDPRTDVYGLGATLYELLTQQPACSGTTRAECLHQILEEEPAPLRRLNRAVPAELETVVHKAMAKLPEERYSTAQELADDLRRFLNDQPIRARPPGLQELVVKWARRHRQVVTMAVLGLVVTVVVLGVTTWRIARAEVQTQTAYQELKEEQERTKAAYLDVKTEQERTRSALKEEAAQRARAEDNYRKAREVLDFLNRLGVEEMAGKPELQALRRRLLARLLDYYQAFIDQPGANQAADDELIDAQLQVSQLLIEVGRKADALAAFEKAMRDCGLPGRGQPDHRQCGPCGPPRGIARLFLLGQPAVQKELDLSADQAEKLKAVLDFGSRPPSNEEALAAEKGFALVLRSDQAERLEQIIRQMRGPNGLLDPETARALGLKERQKEQIQAILDRVKPGPEPPNRPSREQKGRKPGPGERSPVDAKQGEEQALLVLDAEQRARWRALLGKPFRGDICIVQRPTRPRSKGATAYTYYEGNWRRLPDFRKLTPAGNGSGPAFGLEPARRAQHYAFRFEGIFGLPGDAECTFTLSSDDGSRLYIDGKLVVDNDGCHPVQTRQGKASLTRGAHQVVVEFFQCEGEADLAVEIQASGLGRHNLGDLVVPTQADLDRAAFP